MAVRVGNYLLFEVIGEGAFGKVRLGVHDETGQHVAVKIMDKTHIKRQEMSTNVRREIAIMKALDHPNIVSMLQVLTSSTKLYIVMEIVTGGELFTKILREGSVPEPLARKYFQQLVDAVDYCHRRGVCHRDLKPENLLIDEKTGALKITDFGLSALLRRNDSTKAGLASSYGGGMLDSDGQEDLLLHTQCGSVNYVAPEVLSSAKDGYSGQKIDAWAAGIILFALLAGYLPFFSDDVKSLYRMIQRDPVRFPRTFPSAARDLVAKLLEKDPDVRYSLADCRTHPWFSVGYELDTTLSQPVTHVVWNAEYDKKSKSPTGSAGDQRETSTSTTGPAANPVSPSSNRTPGPVAVSKPASDSSTTEPRLFIKPTASESPLIDRITAAVAVYRQVFQVHTSGLLFQSKSFRDSSSSLSLASSLLGRAKAITAAWYVTLSQVLELGLNTEDSQVISLQEMTAFEGLLRFWGERARTVGEQRKYWWLDSSPISKADTTSILRWMDILKPKNVEGKLVELVAPPAKDEVRGSSRAKQQDPAPVVDPVAKRSGAPDRARISRRPSSRSPERQSVPAQRSINDALGGSDPQPRSLKSSTPRSHNAGELSVHSIATRARAVSDVTGSANSGDPRSAPSWTRPVAPTVSQVERLTRDPRTASAKIRPSDNSGGIFAIAGRAMSDVSGKSRPKKRAQGSANNDEFGKAGSNRVLGGQSLVNMIRRRSTKGAHFQTHLNADQCLHELGKIMTYDGCVVTTKRNGEPKLKVEVPMSSGEPLILSFLAREDDRSTTVIMKRARSDRSGARASHIQDVYQATHRKFIELTEELGL